jgi:hypothetical protein
MTLLCYKFGYVWQEDVFMNMIKGMLIYAIMNRFCQGMLEDSTIWSFMISMWLGKDWDIILRYWSTCLEHYYIKR